MIGALKIEQMNRNIKLQAMELRWRSIACGPEKLAVPDSHKKVLAKRLAKVAAGKGEFLTIAQLKQRLAKTGWRSAVVQGKFPVRKRRAGES